MRYNNVWFNTAINDEQWDTRVVGFGMHKFEWYNKISLLHVPEFHLDLAVSVTCSYCGIYKTIQ